MNYRNRKRQQGMSLIELMIAIPIGLLVMLGVAQVFRASLEGVYIQNSFSRVQENGRMAAELITRDIRAADYWGCVGDIDDITNNLDTSDSDYDSSLLPTSGEGVDGENDVSGMTEATITVKDGTDTLILRGSNSLSGVKVTSPYMSTSSSDLYVSTGSTLEVGELVVVSDCMSANLFTNTSATTSSSGLISHGTGDLSGITGAINNATDTLDKEYDGSAQVLIPYTKVYFIGENGSESYSLYRSDDGVATELIRGVNDMQITYGEDGGTDGSANSFNNADAVASMDSVVSVKVELTAESGTSSYGTELEKVYQVTSNIRNRSLQ